MVKCPECRGKGYGTKMVEIVCTKCGGTGRDNKANCYARFCEKCGGNKKLTIEMPAPENICYKCDGLGYIEKKY